MITDHIKKENLHHAYLLEGDIEIVLTDLLTVLADMGISKDQNPDFLIMRYDSFRMDDMTFLKSLTREQSFLGGKKVFLLLANSFLLEAQNAMLKIFEEPKKDMHFFIITPSLKSLLPTFVSRFYSITKGGTKTKESGIKEIINFLNMTLPNRINFLKEFLAEEENEEENAVSARTKALQFLDNLELFLYTKKAEHTFDSKIFEQILITRKYIRQPGSSNKMLLESLALNLPTKI